VSDDRWGKVYEAFDVAVKLAPPDRQTFLDRACGNDPTLLAQVLALLAGDDEADRRGFLEPPFPEATDPRPSLDDYPGFRIIRELGEGGMGTVYLAEHRIMERFVAFKVIRRDLTATPALIGRFRREVRAAAKLIDRNIVTAYDAGEVGDSHVLIMEYVDGTDLARHVKDNGPMRVAEACDAVRQAASGLQHAFESGVVHRDIKPQNLMRTPKGQIKILDFGVARLKSDPGPAAEPPAILGTANFIAPEQIEDSEQVDIRADIYSLGCTLYYLLTGQPPFPNGTRAETLSAQASLSPRPISGVPEGLNSVLARMMAKEPQGRYQTPSEVARALAPFVNGATPGERASVRPHDGLEPTAPRLPIGEPDPADGLPTRARRGGPGSAARWIGRHPAPAIAVGAVAVLLLALAVATAGFEARARRRETASRVRAQVQTLGTIETSRVPDHLKGLAPYRKLADPLLRKVVADAPAGSRERLHAALALLPSDPGQADFLADRLLVATPEEMPVIDAALAGSRLPVSTRLWNVLGDESRDNVQRLRAADFLALNDPGDPRWAAAGPGLARVLAMEGPSAAGRWGERFRLVGVHLLPTLAELLADGRHDAAERRGIAALYATLARDVPGGFAPLEGRLAGTDDASRPEDGRRDEAKSRAVSAASLLLMGREERVWPLLRHTPDPTVRSYLIEACGAAGVDPMQIVARLRVERDVSSRRALVLALGGYRTDQIGTPDRERLADAFLDEYRRHPDAGLHGALQWLLDRWGEADRVRRIDRDMELVPPGDRRWVVNSQGQCYAVVSAPARSGPTGAKGRRAAEYQFALATKEVTPYQFRRFVNWIRTSKHSYSPLLVVDSIRWNDPYAILGPAGRGDGPALGILWHEAAAYCNWLSQQDGIPKDQWCYMENPAKGGAPPLVPAPEFPERAGYRLPTTAEWTLACNAGASTTRAFGRGDELLDHYGRCLGNSEGHAWPVGQLKPNDLGLFDLYGNAREHCDDPGGRAQRFVCGGSFADPSRSAGSCDPDDQPPTVRGRSVGFRPARTIIVTEKH
jgi:predicted Ser/Thr protein kinase